MTTQAKTLNTSTIDLIYGIVNTITSTDDIAMQIKNNVTDFVTNSKLFSTETDTNKLDNYSKLFEKSTGNLIFLLKPCSISTNSDSIKCKSTICKYNNEIQLIITYMIGVLYEICSGNKNAYSFIPFQLSNTLASIISSNPSNKHNDDKFYLCNGPSVNPPNPNSPLYAQYQNLIDESNTLQENRDTRIETNNIIAYLGWSALVIVIIIIGIIIYNVNKKPINQTTTEIVKKVGGFIRKSFY